MNEQTFLVEDSILLSIKKMLGMDKDFTQYDLDIILHINTTIQTLNQIGVIIPDGFAVSDETNTWSQYLTDPKCKKIESMIKNYIYMKVRIIFDPPSTQQLTNALMESTKELEWRINQWLDYYDDNEEGGVTWSTVTNSTITDD